jgi:hypothetical protein
MGKGREVRRHKAGVIAQPASATMVIAEKGADLIRGKAAPAPVALPA